MIALGERRYLEIKIGTADDLQDVTEVGASLDYARRVGGCSLNI